MGALDAMAREVGRTAWAHLAQETITRVSGWLSRLLQWGREAIGGARAGIASRRMTRSTASASVTSAPAGIKDRMRLVLVQLREQAQDLMLSTAQVALAAIDVELVVRVGIEWVLRNVPMLRLLHATVPLRM